MKKLVISKIIAVQIITMMSFSAMSQSNKEIDEKSYFDIKELISPYTSWGINPYNPANINLTGAWKHFKKNKNIVVAVVDTGVDPTHEFLAKNIFIENGKVESSQYGVDFSKDKKSSGTPLDNHGHGSHVSGIIKSIYPEVLLLELKYYNASASGEDNLNSTVEALRYAVDHNVDVINYSGGGEGASRKEFEILKEAEKKGILVVVAAGNNQANIDDKKTAYYPASYGLKNVITVTAYDENLQILNSSNFGSHGVDIFAPGYRIKSSLNNGRSGYLTGTSQATAFVTGVAALIKAQYPTLSAEKVKEIINSSAKKEDSMKGKCLTGARLDATSALAAAKEVFDGLSVHRELANAGK
ncbi:MAG: S8 family serine peptidase [Bacteriovorax sp.]|nr:S8 family serine peptidase [Bacteriovorax sp.]